MSHFVWFSPQSVVNRCPKLLPTNLNHSVLSTSFIILLSHSVGFYPKNCHFCPTFRDKIDESFLRFFSLTLILLDSIILVVVQFGKMNETKEKY